jgi:hypothetical protein
MPYTYSMKLEQVLPMLRDGKCISREKPQKNGGALILFVRMINERLHFMFITSTGEQISWAYYTLKTEDVTAENWEVAE